MNQHNEKGNALLMVLFVLTLLTAAGIYGSRSASVELSIAGSAKKSKQLLHIAEQGMQYAIANLEGIYFNNNGLTPSGPLYTGNADWARNGGVLYCTGAGNIDLDLDLDPTSLRDLDPTTEGVIFMYSTNPNPPDGEEPVVSAIVEIRAILQAQDPPIFIDGLSDAANNTPDMNHIGPPPLEFDGTFRTRRFAITSTAVVPGTTTPSNTSVQAGTFVIVELEKFAHYQEL